MKFKFKVVLLVLITGLITSCADTFYQVYQVTPDNDIEANDNYLVFEDENCKVVYDLWRNGGDIGFRFINKTDKNIMLNLENSYFIINGTAFNYYKNRTFTKSESSGLSATSSVTSSKSLTGINFLNLLQTNKGQASKSTSSSSASGYSVSYQEQKAIAIPSKTSKEINEYYINNALYRDCDLFKYPKKKEIITKTFSKNESPIVFSNRISYKMEGSDDSVKFENEFYVSGISNYPETEMLESRKEEFCDQESSMSKKYIKGVAPNKFYIKYSKGKDKWKH